MSFVLDNSVAMCWLLANGKPADVAYAEAVLDALREQAAGAGPIAGRSRPAT